MIVRMGKKYIWFNVFFMLEEGMFYIIEGDQFKMVGDESGQCIICLSREHMSITNGRRDFS